MPLEETLKKLESYRIDSHERNFLTSASKVRQVYWLVNTLDVLKNRNREEYLGILNYSYWGVFYKVLEFQQAVKGKFNGLSRYEWDAKGEDFLTSWRKQLGRKRSSNLTEIIFLLSDPENQLQSSQLYSTLNEFDQFQGFLDQPVSYFLNGHLLHPGYKSDLSPEVPLEFDRVLKTPTLRLLDKNAQEIVLGASIHYALSEIDEYFKQNTKSDLRNKYSSHLQFETIQSAVADYLQADLKLPEHLRSRSRKNVNAITYELSVMYTDLNSKRWTKNAIRKVVKEHMNDLNSA